MTTTVNYSGPGNLSIDVKVDEDRAFRASVPTGGSANVPANIGLDELDRIEAWTQLTSRADVSLTITGLTEGTAAIADLVDGGTTNPDDVVLVASMPFDARVTGSILNVTTAVVAETVTVRDEPGGAGQALSNALAGGVVAKVEDDGSVGMPTIVAGSALVARRSHDGIEGQIVVNLVRVG